MTTRTDTIQFPVVPLDFDEVAQILDNIVDNDFPEEMYRGLTGGIYLLPEEKHNARIPSNRYYVLGEYREQAITILHGTIGHELRHHMEGRAGERGLEVEDEIFVQRALRRLGVWPGKEASKCASTN